jgi:hypothetical protein
MWRRVPPEIGPCNGFTHDIMGCEINSYGMFIDLPAPPVALIERVDRPGPARYGDRHNSKVDDTTFAGPSSRPSNAQLRGDPKFNPTSVSDVPPLSTPWLGKSALIWNIDMKWSVTLLTPKSTPLLLTLIETEMRRILGTAQIARSLSTNVQGTTASSPNLQLSSGVSTKLSPDSVMSSIVLSGTSLGLTDRRIGA